jgi:transcriptional regulator with GAF, ATPase, and Fis domain
LGSRGSTWGLSILHSPDSDKVGTTVRLGKELRIGREGGDALDLEMRDAKMSRRHATLWRRGLVFELEDHGSSNGSHVNGQRVEKRSVGVGDIIRLGESLFEVAPVAGSTGDDAAALGRAAEFVEAVALADRGAASTLPVLLLGETGTGKEVLARRVHARSRRGGAFVAVNCAALPRDLAESVLFGHKKGAFTGATADAGGLFVQADRGTLFLDEVGELPADQQAKLLRVLETHELMPVGGDRPVRVDARVVAATNAELRSGGFRSDLYARLAGVVVRLPPLRERRGDILALARHFLAETAPGVGFALSAHAAEKLLLHAWPRNIRELRTVMQRLALLLPSGGAVSRQTLDAVLDVAEVSAAAAETRPAHGRAGAPDRAELVARLASVGGNVNRLATHYGKDAKQIYRWLKRFGIDPDDHR